MIAPIFYSLFVHTPSKNNFVVSAGERVPGFNYHEIMIPIMRAEKILDTPVEVAIKNTKHVDMMYGLDSFYLSERTLKIFQDAGFSGWSTFPIEVKRPAQWTKKYLGLSITGRCGNAVGTGVDVDQWDGSDFSTFSRGYSVVVTEKVISALQAENITGVAWEKIPAIKDGEWLYDLKERPKVFGIKINPPSKKDG